MHWHEAEEEQFYVLEGKLTYWIGDHIFQVSAGDFIHIPRQTPHRFTGGASPHGCWRRFHRLLARKAPLLWRRERGLRPEEADPWLSSERSP